MNNLEEGDQVLTVLTPSDSFLNIKNLNDHILGPQRTDTIIAKRRKSANKAFNSQIIKMIENNEEWTQKFSNLDDLNLDQNFKYGVYKIPQEITQGINLSDLLDFIHQEVDNQMEEEINKQLDLALAEARKNNDEQKVDNIEYFKIDLRREGFKVNCGVSEVKEDDIKNKILSLAQSLQAAKINDSKNEGGGRFFSESELQESVAKIDIIRNEIIASGNQIVNQDGYSFNIFLKTNQGKFKINKSLLRDVRKEKFEPQDESQREILRKLVDYKEALNIVDFIKPFPSDAGEKFKEELVEINEFKEALNNKDQKKYLQVKKKLQSNEKDPRFINNDLFESEAIKIDHCTYLSLDVLDIGVDQLLKYEELLQDVSSGEKNIEDVSVEADDFITKRLQEIRKKAADIISEYQDGKLLNDDGLVISLVGGDELCFAIDNNKISEADLENIIFKLKEATNTRVIKTVIAQSERNSDSTDQNIRLKEHLLALNRSEKGIEMIKEIELEVRKLKLYLKNKILIDDTLLDGKLEDLDNSFNIKMEEDIKEFGLDSLIALEDKRKEIKFKTTIGGKVYSQDEILNIISNIKNKYKGGKDAS
ncbi:hypothetical protein K8R66_01750 [bacterium]|nr:hypothetical protein [bacterium]